MREYIENLDEGGITAISMSIDPIDCDEPCDVIIIVTWKNTGNEKEKFRPKIRINGEEIQLDTEITLRKNQTTTQTFNIINLMEGNYTVCPYPN